VRILGRASKPWAGWFGILWRDVLRGPPAQYADLHSRKFIEVKVTAQAYLRAVLFINIYICCPLSSFATRVFNVVMF